MVVLTALLVALPAAAFAAEKAKTAEDAAAMEQGAKVHLTGNIEQQADGMYLFKDDTGQIKLKIPDEVMKDRQFEPDQKVKVRGKLEIDENGNKYVHVEKLNKTMGQRARDIF